MKQKCHYCDFVGHGYQLAVHARKHVLRLDVDFEECDFLTDGSLLMKLIIRGRIVQMRIPKSEMADIAVVEVHGTKKLI